MSAIRSQKRQYDEVGDQKGEVESIDLIKAFERGIQKMLADVWPNAARRENDSKLGRNFHAELRTPRRAELIRTLHCT